MNLIWQLTITLGFPLMMYLLYKYCESVAEELDRVKNAVIKIAEILEEMEGKKK